jgi:two-component system, NarL family, nitrate/nitrite response regulator NarL
MKPNREAVVVTTPAIKVSIIEDHGIVRAGLRMLLENQPGIEVVSESSNVTAVLNDHEQPKPDIILLDLDLGTEHGDDFVPQLLAHFAPVRVLVLTAIPDMQAHLRAVKAGASGIVMKEQAPESLVQAILAINAGDAWLGRSLTAAALAKLCEDGVVQKLDPEAAKIALLTAREKEIVALVTEGMNSQRIAEKLVISEATVRNHLTSILAKLGLANKFELAVFAFRNRLNVSPNMPKKN